MGTQVNMNMRVAGVHKALVLASYVTDIGYVVVLSKFGSFVVHDPRRPIHKDCIQNNVICTRTLAVQTEWRVHVHLSGFGVNNKHQHKQERASVT